MSEMIAGRPPASGDFAEAGANPLASLTDKQREVLDLLIEHKTSKEISRLLGISPHTVDQRINGARARLGGLGRGQVASEYRRLRELWDSPVYQFSYMAPDAYLVDSRSGSDAAELEDNLPSAVATEPERAPEVADYRVGPALFEGPWGTWARLGAIAILALLMIFTVLGGSRSSSRYRSSTPGNPAGAGPCGQRRDRDHPTSEDHAMTMTINVAQMRIEREVREAEEALNEALLCQSQLFTSMLAARRDIAAPVMTGQDALMRLSKSQQSLLSAGGDMARVHGRLAEIGAEIEF